METVKLRVLQYGWFFLVLTILASLLGALTTFDIKYLWLGNWENIPRGITFLLIMILSFINTSRSDGKVVG